MSPAPPVLLIDELDRADEAFEAYLLEILSDFQVTIPELGTVKAPAPPIVIITSNRTREIHDALKRRCLYHWVDYPSAEREFAIVKTRVPGISAKLSQQVVRFVQALRDQDFYKSPGVAETIDWATALCELDARSLTPQVVGDTLGALLEIPGRYRADAGRYAAEGLEGSDERELTASAANRVPRWRSTTSTPDRQYRRQRRRLCPRVACCRHSRRARRDHRCHECAAADRDRQPRRRLRYAGIDLRHPPRARADLCAGL